MLVALGHSSVILQDQYGETEDKHEAKDADIIKHALRNIAGKQTLMLIRLTTLDIV